MHSLDEQALGTRSNPWDQIENKMAIQKRARRAKLFYRNLERTVRLTAEKICPKSPEKVDQEKFYAVEVRFEIMSG